MMTAIYDDYNDDIPNDDCDDDESQFRVILRSLLKIVLPYLLATGPFACWFPGHFLQLVNVTQQHTDPTAKCIPLQTLVSRTHKLLAARRLSRDPSFDSGSSQGFLQGFSRQGCKTLKLSPSWPALRFRCLQWHTKVNSRLSTVRMFVILMFLPSDSQYIPPQKKQPWTASIVLSSVSSFSTEFVCWPVVSWLSTDSIFCVSESFIFAKVRVHPVRFCSFKW